MFRVIDESRSVDMTAKYKLGQEVVLTGRQGYCKGIVTGVAANSNDKGVVFVYTVELYVNRKAAPKVKKCREDHLYGTVKEALLALAERAEAQAGSEQDQQD